MTMLRNAAPVLCVTDIRTMLPYFEHRLGFELRGSAGDLPSWASMQRDGIEIMLVCGNYPAPAADWAAYLYVTDADALYAELKERGADLVAEPVDKPHGCREFEARLPDGRLLAFGANIAR
jgi:predicted enzyme related to lactoylglutathione lyase